jgi:branched-chain amino acid transport system ATP-binding protein
MSHLLRVEALVAGYEPATPIVKGVDLQLARGEILAVLGPNGAGKSTLIRAIAGLLIPCDGSVHLGDVDLTRQPVHQRCAQGLAYVPQLENVFANLSVEDNLALAVDRMSSTARRDRIRELLSRYAELAARTSLPAGRLSGGQRQTLAVARALMARPQVLLLDEPTAGLSPRAVTELTRQLRDIATEGVAIMLVEQNVRAALAVADRVLVLADGQTRLTGLPAELSADPKLAAIYLGGRTTALSS